MSKTSILLILPLAAAAGWLGAHGIPSAHAGDGWKCYVVDRLPDPTKAQDWRGAENVSAGLNKISPNTPAGTLIAVQYPTAGSGWATTQSDVGLICVKD